VAEMLVQSNENEILLLLAIPDAWNSGSVAGICARGGFEISMEWDNHILKKVIVYSKKGGATLLKNGNKQHQVWLKVEEKLVINWK
jgi:alpha-L-fucosidase 2